MKEQKLWLQADGPQGQSRQLLAQSSECQGHRVGDGSFMWLPILRSAWSLARKGPATPDLTVPLCPEGWEDWQEECGGRHRQVPIRFTGRPLYLLEMSASI